MADHARSVLAAIVPRRRDLLLQAQQTLQDEHFTDKTWRTVWKLLERYYEVAGDILPAATLADLLARQDVDESESLLYEQAYAELEATEIADHEFRYACDALRDARAKHMTGIAITTSFEILERQVEVEGEVLRGHQDARRHLYAELATIDRLQGAESAPEGDMRHESDRIMQAYADKASGKTTAGIYTGIDPLDRATGGFQPGELVLIAAYTSQGKTQMTVQCAWHAAVVLGKNVYFGTSETVRDQVWRRLCARHSRLPQFGLRTGLDSDDIKNGVLTEEHQRVYQDVLQDLRTNPAYGRLYIGQVPRGATLGFLEARMKRQADLWHMDLALFDYLPLLKPDRHRDSAQHELNDLLKDAKVFATSFYDGAGVPFVSPWQISQSRWKDAIALNRYTLASLADTSEAEKSADTIVTLLRNEESKHKALMQTIKLRDGDIPEPFEIDLDYRNSYLGTEESAVDSVNESDDFMRFLS